MSDAPAHPIVEVALGVLRPCGDRLVLPEEGRTRLTEALADRFGRPDLPAAVCGLLRLAFFLEHVKQSPDAAVTIIDVLRTARASMGVASARGTDGALENHRRARMLIGAAPERPVTGARGQGRKWWEVAR